MNPWLNGTGLGSRVLPHDSFFPGLQKVLFGQKIFLQDRGTNLLEEEVWIWKGTHQGLPRGGGLFTASTVCSIFGTCSAICWQACKFDLVLNMVASSYSALKDTKAIAGAPLPSSPTELNPTPLCTLHLHNSFDEFSGLEKYNCWTAVFMELKGDARSEGWFWLTLWKSFESTLAKTLLSIN